MARQTSPSSKTKIVEWRKAKKSHKWIREHLKGRHDISDSQIRRIEKRYTEKENYYDVGKSSGRPRKLQPRDSRQARRLLANGTVHNATELQREFFPDASAKTVKRDLSRGGLEAHIRRPVPLITKRNLKGRREWSEAFLNWVAEDWRRVLFSDESIFRVFGTDGIQWCWRNPHERLDPRFTQKRVKHGGGKVTVWGMITPHGLGRLVRIEGNLNAQIYCQILQEDLLGKFDDLDLDRRDYYFQQDNDPKHTSRVATTWFATNKVDVLPWAANSPDLNITEHVWDHLNRKVRARRPLPTNEDQLWKALQEEWCVIDDSFITKLYDSLPRRVLAVHEAKGGKTRY
jgi:hypothetical protein